jgi:hypothetical protein
VRAEPEPADRVIGGAHVAAYPPERDEIGQIPAVLRARLAVLARRTPLIRYATPAADWACMPMDIII